MPNIIYAAAYSGMLWSGQTAPQTTLGADGDHYRDRNNGNVYYRDAGVWVLLPNFGGGAMIVLTPVYAATVTVDLTSYSTYPIVVVRVGTLTGNITFNVTNGFDGQVIRVRFTQDGTGSRIFTPGAGLRFSADIAAIVLSTAATKVDKYAFEWDATASKADVLAENKGY